MTETYVVAGVMSVRRLTDRHPDAASLLNALSHLTYERPWKRDAKADEIARQRRSEAGQRARLAAEMSADWWASRFSPPSTHSDDADGVERFARRASAAAFDALLGGCADIPNAALQHAKRLECIHDDVKTMADQYYAHCDRKRPEVDGGQFAKLREHIVVLWDVFIWLHQLVKPGVYLSPFDNYQFDLYCGLDRPWHLAGTPLPTHDSALTRIKAR